MYVFVEKKEKYQFFCLKKSALSGAMYRGCSLQLQFGNNYFSQKDLFQSDTFFISFGEIYFIQIDFVFIQIDFYFSQIALFHYLYFILTDRFV